METRFDYWLKRASAAAPIIIALCALLFSFYQAYLGHRHNKLSVTPRLEVDYDLASSRPEPGLYIVNTGLGPASLKEFHIFGPDNNFDAMSEGAMIDLLNGSLFDGFNRELLTYRYFAEDQFIRAGERVGVLFVRGTPLSEDENLRQVFYTAIQSLAVSINYESVYGDEFAFP